MLNSASRSHLPAISIAVIPIALLSLVGSIPLGHVLMHPAAPLAATVSGRGGVEASRLLAAAEKSLENGMGPAYGQSIGCQNTSANAANCSGDSSLAGSPLVGSPFQVITSPSARYGARWDVDPQYASTAFVLFGGASSSDPNQPTNGSHSSIRGTVFGDTWALTGTPTASSVLSWTNVTPAGCSESGACPLPRHDEGIAYDPTDGYLVLFGGCEYPNTGWVESTPGCPASGILGDTWKFSQVNSVWTWTRILFLINGTLTKCGNPGEPVCPSTLSPSPRYAMAMTNLWNHYSGTGPALLFGGCGVTGDTMGNCTLGDTWQFSSGAWSQIATGGSDCGGPYTSHEAPCPSGAAPVNRWGASVGNWGSGSQGEIALLFGGCGGGGIGCPAGELYGDTWEFSAGTGWGQLGNCGGPPHPGSCGPGQPSPRVYAALSGTAGGDACLFGGTNGVLQGSLGADGDDWAYTSTGWGGHEGFGYSGLGAILQVAPRFDAVDSAGDQCWTQVLFGGTSPSGSSLSDTQVAFKSGTQASSGYTLWPPAIPSARFGASMVYDSTDSLVVLFGGCGMACPSNETWTYGKCLFSTLTTPVCDPVPSSSALVWTLWNNSASAAKVTAACQTSNGCPAARYDASAAWDGSEVVLFGGVAVGGRPLGDTWYFTQGAGWTFQRCSGTCPSARAGAAAAFDSASSIGGVILFGGWGASGLLRDTWEWTNGLAWTQLSPTGSLPTARANASMAYDVSDGYLLLYGGSAASGSPYLSDTWEFTLTKWTQLSPHTSPGSLAYASMAYDSTDGYVVLFGGVWNIAPPYTHTTWEFLSGSWTIVSPLGCNVACPNSVQSAAIAFDAASGAGYILLTDGLDAPRTVLSNISSYSGGTWSTFAFANPISDPVPSQARPVGELGSRMAYDPALNRVVLVGGCGAICWPVGFTTWEFFNGSWIAAPFVVSDQGGPPPCPSPTCFPQFDPAVAYLPRVQAVVVFGGFVLHNELGNPEVMGDTWELRPNASYPGGVWTLFNFTGAIPAPRADAMMVDDATDGYLLLFGGCSNAPRPYGTCNATRADTWSFSGTAWTQVSERGGAPSGRAGAGMVYSPVLKEVLMFEGWNGTSASVLNDEVTYSGGSWQLVGISSISPARWDLSTAWDSYDNSTVAFGGFGCSSTNVTNACGDTWVASGTSFVSSGVLGPGTPSPRGDSAMAFTPVEDPEGELLLFAGGGLGFPGESDTSQFLGSTGWCALGLWV